MCVYFLVRKKKPNGSWHSFEMKNFDWTAYTAQNRANATWHISNLMESIWDRRGGEGGKRSGGMIFHHQQSKPESERKIWKTLIRNTKMCLRPHRQFSSTSFSLSLSLSLVLRILSFFSLLFLMPLPQLSLLALHCVQTLYHWSDLNRS